MNTFKKITSVLIITIFSFINIVGVSAVDYVTEVSGYNYENTLIKEIILSKKELENIKNGEKYIEKIDGLIEKIKNKKETLEKLNKKISELIGKFYAAKKTAKNKDILILLNYLNVKVELALYRLNKVEEESQISEIEKKIVEMKNPSLSESEIKKVNEKLVNIQLNLLDNTNSLFEKLLKEYEDFSSYEEKGDMKFNFSLDHELIGKIKTELKLNDYSAKNSGFDAQFTSQIEALIEATPKGEEEIKLQLKSFIDFISKDGNMYLLLDKFNITDEKGIKDIKQQVETLKELAEKNKYIKIEDKSTQDALKYIETLNPATILNDSKKILSEPLFKPYKKDGDKYLLVPTKYACDEFKKLQARFDPFNGDKCSDSQYETLLKEIAKFGDLYIEIGTSNKLGFNAYSQFDVEKFESSIIFTDTSIEKINSILETKKQGEGFNLEYIKNNKLDFNINAGDEVQLEFISKLDRSNNFTFIKSFIESNEGINGKLNLENKNITGNFDYEYKEYAGYDYQNNKYKYNKNHISILLDGKLDYKNKIQDLVLNIIGKDELQKEFLNIVLSKNNDNYEFNLEASNNDIKVIDSNIKLENKKITGTTKVYNNSGEEQATITNNGKYENDYLEINTKVKLSESPFSSYFGYLDNVRDTNRIAHLRYMSEGLYLYSTNHSLPLPDNYKEVKEDGKIIAYKGKIGKSVLEDITYSIEGVDPLTKEYFNYYLTADKKHFILQGCLEKENYKGEKIQIQGDTYNYDYKTGTKTMIDYGSTEIDCSEFENLEDLKEIKPVFNLNIKVDTKNNKNNANIYIDYSETEDKILEIELDNKSTKSYKDIEIEAPTNTMELEEAMGIGY